MMRMPVRMTVTTAGAPGAVAIVQLAGEGVAAMLSQITDVADWPLSRMRHVRFADIDRGLALRLRDDWAQLMPHGGPRVVDRIIDRLLSLGCHYDAAPAGRVLYPEAASDLEADMLAALAGAASPAAIDLLLSQPENWRRRMGAPDAGERGEGGQREMATLVNQSRVLHRLIDPPAVVVVGQPNVGKSTLTNRMLGRAASIVAHLPGTTRDWVAGLAELPGPLGGIAVRWMDTPGLRSSDDPIEQQAIEAAQQVIAAADVLIAMRDPQIGWPPMDTLPRLPDLWVMNKIDAAGGLPATGSLATQDSPLPISAATGTGVDALGQAVISRLGLAAIDLGEAWAFSDALRELAAREDEAAARRYCGCL